ncbi:MAG TPA: glycosyltransferase family 2 protein [Bacteroidota bacterium]|nr:glycosyltransferase family 2 protein [Bacteroidota bacterium]
MLSICIATYNRGAFISRTLESIVAQLRPEVEIVVVDGASTDDTESVVKRFAAKSRSIRYILLPKKGGVDQDYCTSVELARGKYVWLFTDDDVLEPGAIARVLRELRSGFSLLTVNARVMDSGCDRTLVSNMMGRSADIVFDPADLEGLFSVIVPYVSFIGCLVIERKIWLERETRPYLGSEFVHVGVVFQSPLPGKSLVIADPLVTIRYGNAQWTTRASAIWLSKWPKLLWSFANIPDAVKREKVDPVSLKELRKLVVFRALGSYSRGVFGEYLLPGPSPFWWKAIAYAVTLIPAVWARVFVAWYLKKFRWESNEARLTYYDLVAGHKDPAGNYKFA